MSKLVFSFNSDHPLQDGAALTVALPAAAHGRLGEPVLLARRTGSVFLTYVAVGTLQHLAGTTAQIVDIMALPHEIPSFRIDTADLFEISEQEFDGAVSKGTSALGEIAQPALIQDGDFSADLSARYRDRCAFSDVRTYAGTPVIIRPLALGGRWHISNFLFLDPEPGHLFTSFAWTVGPRFEIIIDAHAVEPDVADTVNRTGMLALPARADLWPDRNALAWHFDRFIERLQNR